MLTNVPSTIRQINAELCNQKFAWMFDTKCLLLAVRLRRVFDLAFC